MHNETLGRDGSPVVRLNAIRDSLRETLHFGATAPTSALVEAIAALSTDLESLITEHVDTLLCVLLVDDLAPYAEIHPLMVAITCEVVARNRALDSLLRGSIRAAALTCNLGMFALQQDAARQSSPLDPAQRSLVNEHPLLGATLLQKAGVTDPVWLDVVRHHHEKVDGSGYPLGLKGSAISPPSRLVALADIYAAMVLPRQYRDGVHAQNALREIFLLRGTHIDAGLAADFIRLLGVYPPGIFVRLKSGELGVVIKRGESKRRGPVIGCFRSAHGGAYAQPLWRDTSPGASEIDEVLPRQFLPCSIPALYGMQ